MKRADNEQKSSANLSTSEKVALRARVKQTLISQVQSRPTMLSALLAIQDELDYIPEEAIGEVADFCNVSVNDVWGVVDYYTNFRYEKPSGTVVKVCWGPTCHIKGAQGILQSIKDNFAEGGDESDKGITLEFNTCLGACAQAPVIAMEQHELFGKLTPDSAVELVRNHISKAKSDKDGGK